MPPTMTPEKILEQIGLIGIVPVIAIEKGESAEPLARALVEGGLPCAEVTFRTAAAPEAMKRISRSSPELLLGAGTVLSIDQVKQAIDCGANFIVSPGLNRKVVEYCVKEGIAVTPGVSSPTDVEAALEIGLSVVKFFPAEPAGGLNFLKALAGPYGKVRYIPTGGIDEGNLLSYLKFPKVLACGGSWMVKQELISSGEFDRVRELTARAVHLMLGFSLKQVSIPQAPGSAEASARALGNLLGLPVKGGSIGAEFALTDGGGFAVTLGTHFPDRGAAYLRRRGCRVEPLEGPMGGMKIEAGIAGLELRLAAR